MANHYNFAVNKLPEGKSQRSALDLMSIPPFQEASSGWIPTFEALQTHSKDLVTSANSTHTSEDIGIGTISCEAPFITPPIELSSNLPHFNAFGISAVMPPVQYLTDNTKQTGRFTSMKTPKAPKRSSRLTCDTCFKQFNRSSTLLDHMRTHIDVRPFVCDKCGKAFTRLKDQKRHLSIHSTERHSVCGGLSMTMNWGCGRQFVRDDGLLLVTHLRSETGRTCLLPLLHTTEFTGSLLSEEDIMVCRGASEKGKQFGCGSSFTGEADVNEHFDDSRSKDCIRQITIQFAMKLLRASRDSLPSKTTHGSGALVQTQPAVLDIPSLTPWHPSALPGEPEYLPSAESTNENMIDSLPFNLELSPEDSYSIGCTAGDIWDDSAQLVQSESTDSVSVVLESVINEVDECLTKRFNPLQDSQQWLIRAYRAGSHEAVNSLLTVVLSPHLLKDNTAIWTKFGEAKCEATWILKQLPKSRRSSALGSHDWYEHRVCATVPPLSTTGSRFPLIKFWLLIDHISRYSEELGDIEKLTIGDFLYLGNVT